MRPVRRRVTLGLASVMLALVVPAGAAPPASGLRAHATFHTTGSTGFRVDARDGLEIDPLHPSFALTYDGSWAAFMVFRRAKPGSGQQELTLGVLEEPSPAGCAAGKHGPSGCPNGKGLTITNYWPDSVSYGGTALNPYTGAKFHYPPGRYDVYLLTEQGKHLTVSWRTGQTLPGQTEAPHAQRVRASYQHRAVPGTKLTAMASGAVAQRLKRTGVLFDMVWASNEPDSQLENDEGQLCVERGEARPDVVAPHADTCATAPDSGFMGGGGGAGGSTYGFSVIGITLVEVAPGLFSVPYSIRMTGLDPQVGTAILAWEYLV